MPQTQEQNTLTLARLDSLSQLLKESWLFFKRHLRTLILISLIMMGPTIINQILIAFFGEEPAPMIGFVIFIFSLLSFVTSIWGTIAMVTFVKTNNPTMTISEAFNNNASLFWSYFWAGLIVGIITFIGIVALIIPGIIIGVYFSFYTYTLICDGIKGYDSAKKSMELVKGYWWPIFGRMIILTLIFLALVIAFVIVLSPLLLLSQLVYSLGFVILGLIITPFSTVYFYRIYQNLKKLKKL